MTNGPTGRFEAKLHLYTYSGLKASWLRFCSAQSSGAGAPDMMSHPGRSNPRPILAASACLFGSGLSALIYQTAWFREFRLIFGASTAATAAVMAIFMGGVGWGSATLGKRADRVASPLRLYGWLELGIAMAAALSPLLLAGVRA